MPVRRGTLSALPTLNSCPHLELLAQLLTRALLTTTSEACLEVVPLTSNQLGTKAQASGRCQPLSTAQASSNSEAALLVWDKPAQPRFQREPRDECIHLDIGQPSAAVSGILEAARPRRPPLRYLAFPNPPSSTSTLGPAS